MEINLFIVSFVAIPFFGFLLSLTPSSAQERTMSSIALVCTASNLVVILGFVLYWVITGTPTINIKETVIYQSNKFEFFIDFYFDKVSAVFLLCGALITLLIMRYSQNYMHLEDGYKRFFSTILFFYFGYNWIVLSGNFETLFIGWEIIGIASFLLIAFYRDRYLPVRNAVKVFTIYRIGDVGILSAMWASHHFWHENITFQKLNNVALVHAHLMENPEVGVFIGVSILVAAAVKSAQLPFSSWLPRAMEGPTPSSAIFYGSLSVHFGVFLLLRTYPFWEEIDLIRFLIFVVGLSTAIITFYITRVQTTIKTQIAYASITQIGLIFIEIALGWHNIALVHFVGNAFLRSYQLLVSPSIVSYMIRDQFYHFEHRKPSMAAKYFPRIHATVYLLSLQEWKLDHLITNYIFRPLKQLGKQLNFLNPKNILFIFIPVYLAGIFLYLNNSVLPLSLSHYLPYFYSFLGLLMVLKSFSERKYPRMAWLLVLFNHFCVALAISFNEHYDFSQNLIYLTGVTFAGILGVVFIHKLRNKEIQSSDLNQYHGHILRYPGYSSVIFLSALGLMGFPITPSFIGEDLIFSHIHADQYLLGIIISLGFIFGGIALIRIYARLFLGPVRNPDSSYPNISS